MDCGPAKRFVLVLSMTLLTWPTSSDAQDQKAPPPESAEQQISEVDELTLTAGRIADKYARLEDLILKLANFEAATNPRRADLLKNAYQQSKGRLTLTQLNAIAEALKKEQLSRAIDGQQVARTDLKALLDLLLSENRSDRLQEKQQRIKEYIKEMKRLERMERGERGRNEGGADVDELAKNQGKIAERAGNLTDRISENEGKPGDGEQNEGQGGEGEGKEGEGEQGEGKQGEGKQGEGKQGEGKEGEGKQGEGKGERKQGEGKEGEGKEGEGKEGEGKQGEGQQGEGQQGEGQQGEGQQGEGQQGEGQQGEGQQGEGQQGEGQQGDENQDQADDEFSPTRKRLKEAEQKMREAKQHLEDARRKESIEAQREAEEKLKEAIAELERILRQMREEEIDRMLALLESRFVKMLEMQLRVYESSLQLTKVPAADRDRRVESRATNLSFEERKIVIEADRALTLLQEEGSSIAFPEVVEQIRDDMQDVSDRLAQIKLDRLTLDIEEEIIQALQEMIDALQKAQQDREEQQQQQQQQPGEPGDEPLVDSIAELKMIRTMQMRINQRTKRFARLLDDAEDPVGQATDTDLRAAIGDLGEREHRLQQITRDIVLGKNR